MAITLKELYDNFNLLPIGDDKLPNFKILNKNEGWKKFREEKIEISRLAKSRLGIITGVNGLEVIDVDNHFGDAKALYLYLCDNYNLEKFPVIRTLHEGYHIYFKSDNPEGNQKLASRINANEKYETLIETRGVGGYVVFYNNIINGDILDVPKISLKEREILLEVCRSLDEKVEKEVIEQKKTEFKIPKNERKPGDIYNSENSSIYETKSILKSHGWQEIKGGFWIRPGKKDKGISATFGRVGVNKFYVFSTNAEPFKSETSYSMFAVKSLLEFKGDFSACAKSLMKNNITTTYKKDNSPQLEKERLSAKWQALIDIIKEWEIEIRYNELTKILDYKEKNIWKNDIDILISDIIFEMENNRKITTISKTKLQEMIMSSHIAKSFNPIQDFYNNLPKWDGQNYIEQLCNQIVLQPTEDMKLFDEMFKKHLIRTLRGAIEDNYTNRIVFVLHGAQNIGKTKIWEWLVPAGLYYDEPINLNDKDSYIALSRYLIINFDDLDQLSRREVGKLKSYISKGNISKRLPYARTETNMKRIASCVGTTNISDILNDTNNTRWLIMKVKSFNWQNYIKNIDPLNIWSQVKELYLQNKEAGELTIEEQYKRDFRNNSEFLETSQERDILSKYFIEDEYSEPMTATEIHMLIEKNFYPVKLNFWKLSKELKRLFGEPNHTSIKGQGGRFYYLKFQQELQNKNETVDWLREQENKIF